MKDYYNLSAGIIINIIDDNVSRYPGRTQKLYEMNKGPMKAALQLGVAR